MESGTPPSIPRVQPSIRSFFQPQQPKYTLPPNSISNSKSSPALASPNVTSKKISPSSKDTRTAALPAAASITHIAPSHVTPLRRINSLLLPINYPDAFYHAISQPSPPSSQNFSRIILWEDKVVGGMVCRLDPSLASSSKSPTPTYIPSVYDIYIQSLVLLSPYRGKGLATKVLEEVVQSAVLEQGVKVAGLYAHVWTENTEALEWYTERGFKREEALIPGYYRRLRPDTAWIFRKKLYLTDHLPSSPLPHQQQQQYTQIQDSTPPPPSLDPSSTNQNQIPRSTSLPANLSRPAPASHARSFQERGPGREWNDLPEDVLANNNGLLNPAGRSALGTPVDSGPSSRSSSKSGNEGSAKGRKKRVYPAAAFGS